MKKLKISIKNSLKVSILFLVIVFLISLFFFGETIGFYMFSTYSNLTKGREIDIGDIKVKIPPEWYISTSKNKISRMPDKDTPVIVAFFEKEDVNAFLTKLQAESGSEILPNIQVGKLEAYSFMFKKSCVGIKGDCYHTVVMIPDLDLEVTVSNYLEEQSFVIDEVVNSISWE